MPNSIIEASYSKLLQANSSQTKPSSYDPIHIFCIKLAKSQHDHTQELTPKNLAQLAKKLIRAESKVGGPYAEPPVDEYITNYAINMFTSLTSLRIDSVSAYGYESRPAHLTNDPQMSLMNDFFTSVLKHRKVGTKASKKHGIPIFYKFVIEENSLDLSPNTTPIFRSLIQNVAKHDKNLEIANISLYFAEMLGPNYSIGLEKYQKGLSRANIFAWAAYTIYDDIHDEHTSANIVGLANMLMRESYKIYCETSLGLGVDIAIVNESFSVVDDANLILEPGLGLNELYKKSYGHTLGPRIILQSLHNANSDNLTKALAMFLNAKQLCDDIKDWEEDIANGSSSYVTRKLDRDLDDDTKSNITTTFWEKTLPESIRNAQMEIEASIELFSESLGQSFEKTRFFRKIIYPIRRTIEDINTEQAEKNDFLNHFNL